MDNPETMASVLVKLFMFALGFALECEIALVSYCTYSRREISECVCFLLFFEAVTRSGRCSRVSVSSWFHISFVRWFSRIYIPRSCVSWDRLGADFVPGRSMCFLETPDRFTVNGDESAAAC